MRHIGARSLAEYRAQEVGGSNRLPAIGVISVLVVPERLGRAGGK
jgi:hypothetical protein